MTVHTRILLADRELEVDKRCSIDICQLTIHPHASGNQESQALPHSKLQSRDGFLKSPSVNLNLLLRMRSQSKALNRVSATYLMKRAMLPGSPFPGHIFYDTSFLFENEIYI